MKAEFIPPPPGVDKLPTPTSLQLQLTDLGGFVSEQKNGSVTIWGTREEFEALREVLPSANAALEKDIVDGAVKVLIAKQIELRIQAQMEATESRLLTEKLWEKANNLARLVEQLALEVVNGYYVQRGNEAAGKLLRAAIADVDALTKAHR